MKIVEVNVKDMTMKLVKENVEEVVACVYCDYLNSKNEDLSKYYMVTTDDGCEVE